MQQMTTRGSIPSPLYGFKRILHILSSGEIIFLISASCVLGGYLYIYFFMIELEVYFQFI